MKYLIDKKIYIIRSLCNIARRKRFLYLFLTLLLPLSFLMVGCSEDLSDFSPQAGDGTVLTIRIPDTESEGFRSRDEVYTNDPSTAKKTSKEGTLNNLWLFAFPQVSDGSEPTAERVIDLRKYYVRTEGEYRVYSVNFKAGQYKFYLFANLDRYLNAEDKGKFVESSSPTITENILNDIALHFDGETQNLIENWLPLAAFPNTNDIDKANENGYCTIVTETTNQINVNLRFLCSKVRHTILFDNNQGGISEGFRNNIIEFILEDEPATAQPLIKETFLQQLVGNGRADNEELSWDLDLKKKTYPDDPTYPSPTNMNDLYDWDDENDGQWNIAGKKAWQYTVYLPENLTDKRTVLTHPYHISGVAGKETKTFELEELKRANMYDIITHVKTTDFPDNNTEIKISDWSLETLSYELHGPYELIVENTSMEVVRTGGWETMGFESDVPDSEIKFEFPMIEVDGFDESLPFFVAQVINPSMTDDDGNQYIFNDEWPSHLRIQVNPEIPYDVLKNLKPEDGKYEFNGITYTKNDLSYFHIVAANLHKRIDINLLDLELTLRVSPLIITIDVRQAYLEGKNNPDIDISFFTNLDVENIGEFFTLTDKDDLLGGIGENGEDHYALQLFFKEDNIEGGKIEGIGESKYKLNRNGGNLNLHLNDILEGNPFWLQNNEYYLTFTLKVPDSDEVLEKTVRIIIKPFTTNYIIHFRDNTKDWDHPHVYVYQLLTLPSDLGRGIGSDGVERDNSSFAGQIVGYIEKNPSSGLQWNGAVQYVFSNNLTFKGWKGYGGPDINNPWDEAHQTFTNPQGSDNTNKSTMGFVMFGNPEGDGSWNYSYAYNVTYGLTPSSKRHDRYNYDANLNEDHEVGAVRWCCDECRENKDSHNHDYNYDNDYNYGADGHFYTGITMERETGENEGWLKYTLTGVAQPGRTMIIFANWHKPWDEPEHDFRPEDYRWPGDYESGLPLFDFEDNEGWFLFDGNTTNTDQKFTDDKPTNLIPHTFTNVYTSNLRIEVQKPVNSSLSDITVNGNNKTLVADVNNKYYVDVNDATILGKKDFIVKIGDKEYTLAPKNFKRKTSGAGYVTADPLYVEFKDNIKLFVKWNDEVTPPGWWDDNNSITRNFKYYYPPAGGSPYLCIYKNDNGTSWNVAEQLQSLVFTNTERTVGNYKFKYFTTTSNYQGADKIRLRLCTSEWNASDNWYKVLKVEDLPKYYNPSKGKFSTEGYYQINWHFLTRPN